MTFRERLQKGFSNQERSFSTLLPDSSKISAESGLEIEGAFHASISRCPSVRDMSIRSTSSSSSTSDPRVGSALSVNIGVEPFGRALNCKVLDRSNRSIGGCERKLWPPVDTCRDQLQQAFALKDRRDVVNVPTDPDLFSSFLQGQRSLDKSESSSTIRSKRSRTGSPVEVKCDSDAVGHDSSRHGKRDNVVEEQRSSSCARFGENLQSVKQGEESTRKDLNRRTPRLHLQVDTCNRDVSNSEFDSRMPASPECMPVLSKGLGTPSQFAEESLKRFTERRVELVNTELHPTSAPGFAEVGSAATHRTVKRESEVGRENEQQQQQQLAAEGGSSSPKLFREKLGAVGSRRHEGGVQFGISSHWADHVPSNNQQQQQQVQDHFNFHGEECITNVDEEDEFRFQSGVEFPIPRDRQGDESRPSTVGRPDFHERPVEYSQGTSRDGRRSPVAAAAKFEIQEDSAAAAAATGTGLRANDSSNVRSLEVEGEEIHQQLGGATSIGRAIPEVLGTGRDKGGRADSHFRKPQASASHVSSEERRVRIRLLDSPMPITGRREPAEDASCTKVARPSRPSAGKDRHSKVNTAKGPRDRRVRLSVPTAVQFYDVQDRLGYDQPSKAVEWLIKNAKTAIDELGRLPSSGSHIPSGGSDITHSSSYSGATGLVNPAAIAIGSSCPISGSFSSGLRGAFVEPVGNQMNYFIDPSVQQQVPSFGNSPMHIRDVEGGLGLDQGHPSNAASQGQLGGLSFCFQSEQADLSRGAMGGSIGGKSLEFQGPPLARSESRVKARERARERVKEKCSGRDDGKATGGSCSPSMQSPSLQHQSLIHGSFSVPSPLQSPIQTHAQNLSRPSLQQSSLSSVFNATLSGIMQSPQPGTLQNLIMQNPSLQSSLTDQFQTSLRRPFQTSFLNTIQNPNLSLHHQHSELHIPSLEGGIVHGPLDRDVHEGFASEHGALSFSGRARSSSNHNPSISQPLAITHPTGHSLPGFGMPSSSSMHMEPEISSESASELMHIRAGFSPGPLGTDFRSHPVSTGHSYIADHQRMIHGYSRTPSQLVVPNYNPTSTGGGPRGQDDSPKDAAGGTCLYYPSSTPPNTRIGNLQLPSGVSMPLDRMSFSSEGGNPGGNVSCDYPSGLQLQVMSPGTSSSPPYQSSSSQIQMPARIQGLEDVHVDFDADKLKGSPLPSSPHLHS